LDVLKQYNVKATFFCVGNNVEKHPTIFQRLLDEQHAVGNHTYNHLNGWKTHSPLYLKNVSKCKELVNSRLFRPPYGKMKKTQFNVLRRYYSIVLWDVLSGDYDKKTSPEKCLKNVLDKYRNGSIIVFHDNIKAWTNLQFALPKFIEHALKEGYRFETL
jgi:peptidoglycan/xylan/chitin deacetylase (PgdA/CDA1 family)